MSINNSRRLVAKLKEDHNFKNKVLETTEPEDLFLFPQKESLAFNPREPVGDMAECMEQLELHAG